MGENNLRNNKLTKALMGIKNYFSYVHVHVAV